MPYPKNQVGYGINWQRFGNSKSDPIANSR
jgi:hypothetical protein